MGTSLTIIRQGAETAECRAVGQASMLLDLSCKTVSIDALDSHADALRSGDALPVGSVEYLRASMRAAGLVEPEWSYYPAQLEWLLRRKVQRTSAGLVIGRQFVKPVKTKLWNGFVFDSMKDPVLLDEHDREQYDAFMSAAAEEQVWISEPMRFLCEWRYYVCKGQLVGAARYDPDGEENAPVPDKTAVRKALRCLVESSGSDLTCALDVGVMDGGETALVEVTDAWALGLYSGAMTTKVYLEMLAARWKQIVRGENLSIA